jgi:RNA-directed DNA polymerase
VRPDAGGKLAGNSEAQRSYKTHQVEPGGTRGQSLYLTWGDLFDESRREVSRGRSSEEAAVTGVERRAEEPKNGAKEGTEHRRNRRTRIPEATTAVAEAGALTGRSGAAAASRERRDHVGVLRTFGKRAMYENLMEEVVGDENQQLALKAVKRNRGAAGIDHMQTTELENHLQAHWVKIRAKLLNGTYVPSPVRRVEIPKPSGGTRMLGIPTVQDRLIQQMLLQVLTPIFDPMFSEHSYGFRPGRSAQDAVRAAQQYAQKGKDWVVDFDITKFFDHVNHDILMGRIANVIRDKRVLHLIGKYLRRGAMVEGVVTASVEGTPQGGPLSPMLANIYLDALDKELERRRHSFCRYADDCNIYVGSQAAAERTLQSIQGWIEKHLRLKVNAAKSGTGRVWERKFLGFRLDRDKRIGVAPESVERFKAKVREMWRGNQSRTSEELRDGWASYARGWWEYFRLAEVRKPIFGLEGWIRRHIRKCFWIRWHSAAGRERALRRLGLRGRMLKAAFSGRGAWHLAGTGSVQTALSNAVLRRYGFLMPSDLAVL